MRTHLGRIQFVNNRQRGAINFEMNFVLSIIFVFSFFCLWQVSASEKILPSSNSTFCFTDTSMKSVRCDWCVKMKLNRNRAAGRQTFSWIRPNWRNPEWSNSTPADAPANLFKWTFVVYSKICVCLTFRAMECSISLWIVNFWKFSTHQEVKSSTFPMDFSISRRIWSKLFWHTIPLKNKKTLHSTDYADWKKWTWVLTQWQRSMRNFSRAINNWKRFTFSTID